MLQQKIRLLKAQYHSTKLSGFDVREFIKFTAQNLKGTLLESMARRMSAADIKTMVKYWDLPDLMRKEPNEQHPLKDSCVLPVETEHPKINVKVEEVVPVVVAEHKQIDFLHPILGELLCDLGYKQTYLTSAKNLILAPIWEKQRILRPDRAMQIAKSKVDHKTHDVLPGVITLYKDATSGAVGVIDGQHRCAALIFLAQRGMWDEYKRNVLVDVFLTKDEKEIKRLFTEINSGEPVRLIDMPSETDDEVVKDDRLILIEVTDNLQQQFAAMFKPSTNCKPPHLNVDKLLGQLYDSKILDRLIPRTAENLLKLILEHNTAIGVEITREWEAFVKSAEEARKERELKAKPKAKGGKSKAASKESVTAAEEKPIETKPEAAPSGSVVEAQFVCSFNKKLKGKTFEQAFKKAQLNNFYLGLVDDAWMYDGSS